VRLIVLVGAGASYGAFDNPSLRPPLGGELFSKLVAAFPESWGSLPNKVAAEFRTEDAGFELGMAALREEAEHTQAALIDMGTFFASFRLLPGVNRYLALAKLLEFREPDVQFSFGSLNYETYLEQSLGRAGRQVLYWGEPPLDSEGPFIRVVKPHGSCNFVVDTGTNTFINFRVVGGQTYISGAPLKVVPLDNVVKGPSTGFPSAMSLYAPGKPDLVCPEFVSRFRADWQSAVTGADAILVVGARPMLGSDPHVWVPVTDSSSPVGLVGGDAESLRQVIGGRLSVLGGWCLSRGLDSRCET
jgi:hypothetical protein